MKTMTSGRPRRSVNLAVVIHNHQPIDNDSTIIEQVYRTSYLPFLRKLSEFPGIKANIHYTGYLLEGSKESIRISSHSSSGWWGEDRWRCSGGGP